MFFDRLIGLCAAFAGLVLAAIALAISANVVLRNAFGTPIFGLLDAVEYGLLLATFLGAPWVLSKSGHVAVDLVTGALPRPTARALARVMAAFGASVCAVVVWYAAQAALISAGKGSMIRTAFTIPEWWVLSVMPAAFALLTIEFVRQAIRPPGTPELAGL
ncbi:TRAP transporter small permease [Chachezhania sediminis]|uniref:TRAP transporter small permease n=1 Tax=Chachezhania sediminis TaxID=2599291 RepID=UPI001E297F38|nr:TRAP transporter small permease [Chachezhania sediminis]